METLETLAATREAIEREMRAIASRLHADGRGPGLSEALVDRDGFPNAQWDLYNVRLDRARYRGAFCLTLIKRD